METHREKKNSAGSLISHQKSDCTTQQNTHKDSELSLCLVVKPLSCK